MKKKKILHLITGLEIGGAEMMLLKTLPRLQGDFDNRVCCIMGRGPMGEQLEKSGVPVYYLELKNIFDFGVIWRFRKVIRDFQPDLLVTYLIHADLFGRVFGRIFGIKTIVCSVRVKLVQPKYLLLLLFDGFTSFLVSHYHFNSQAVADMYHRYFLLSKNKATVIPNGLEIDKYQITINKEKKRKEINIPENTTVIGCIGRLEKQKGQIYLIQALSLLPDSVKNNISLLFIGDGSDRTKLETLSKDLKLEKNVLFLGRRKDVPELLQIIDIFVLPSLYEGMSNAIMEAMASGKPIIATDIPENRELIQNNSSGILIPPENSKALTDAIELIISDKILKVSLEKKARKTAEEKFDINGILEKIKTLYLSQLPETK